MIDETIEKIVQLDIEIDGLTDEELDEFGVEIVSLVEDPAIGVDFMAFNESLGKVRRNPDCPDGYEHEMPDGSYMCGKTHGGDSSYDIELESYTDYPQGATNNAKRALKWADENGWGSCGTPVGKRRANQLAKRQPISEETIARMSAFRRQQQNKNTPYGEGCGGLMWDAWGGDAGINWAEGKLKRIRKERDEASHSSGSYDSSLQQLSLNEEERIVSGPLMIPNKMILRRDDEGTPYYIFFTKSTIKKMAEKFFKKNNQNNTDIQHDNKVTNENVLLESWISEDKMYDKSYKLGFALPMGTWYVSYKVNDDATWERVKAGELKGFSLAGPFIEKMANENIYSQKLQKVIDILSKIDK